MMHFSASVMFEDKFSRKTGIDGILLNERPRNAPDRISNVQAQKKSENSESTQSIIVFEDNQE